MGFFSRIFNTPSSQAPGKPVHAVFGSEEQLRFYIEHELDYAVRTRSPKLDVMFRDRYAPSIARASSRLWWRINDRTASGEERFYALEAYPERKEFVIWFGHVWGRRLPEEAFRPAVHVDFQSYDAFFRNLPVPGALIDSAAHAEGSPGPLARALEHMLANQTNADAYHHTSYPMNRSIY